jgi:chromosome segregation ATPase
VEDLLTLTFGERIADLGLFTLQALVFLLVGGAMMMLIDWTARRLGGDKVSQAQYLTALALSFFLGLFLQWEESYRNSQPLKTQNESLSREIASLSKDLETKNRNIETLERRFDKFTAQLTEFGKDTGKTLQALQKKVKERERQIASLQNHPNENKDVGTNVVELTGKTRKAAMKNQLAQLRAEGNRIIDKALSTPTSRPPADERKQWFTNTIEYLRQNMDAGHVEEFRDPPAPAPHFEGLPAGHDLFASDVEARVKVLQRFTDELREKN